MATQRHCLLLRMISKRNQASKLVAPDLFCLAVFRFVSAFVYIIVSLPKFTEKFGTLTGLCISKLSLEHMLLHSHDGNEGEHGSESVAIKGQGSR